MIQLDEDCEDAKQELENVKIQQLVEMGFVEDQAFAAIHQYSTVQVQSCNTCGRWRIFFFQWLGSPLGGLGCLIFRGFTITRLDIPHSVRLLWTRDQSVAETST